MNPLKIPYYLASTYAIASSLHNPWAIAAALASRPTTLHFKDGPSLKILSALDLLIAKETILDDCYKLTRLNEAAVIVDIGASVGDFAISAALRFPMASVIAFEPDQRYFELLLENIATNRIKNILPYQCALGETKQGSHLGEFVSSTISFLKIDCEGAELNILKRLSHQQLSQIEQISIEYHCTEIPTMHATLTSLLSAAHFTCISVPDRYNSSIGYLYASAERMRPQTNGRSE